MKSDESELRSLALSYLSAQLGAHAPAELGAARLFDASVLEGEGRVAVFEFDASPGGGERGAYFVVVGETEPNYFPRWTLTAEEQFRVHLGTRFMLVVGIGQARDEEWAGYEPLGDVERMAGQVAPGARVTEARAAAMFRAGEELHAVCRCRIGGEEVYALTRDAPPGFYRRCELPPHVVYRLHLGTLLERERDEEEA